MLIGILGINHKLADLRLRETLAKTCQRKFAPDQSIHDRHSFILLSTCNRTEIYFHSEDLAATHTYIMNILRNEVSDDFDQKLYSYFSVDCFLHLARVTAGLDSAIIGETEIQAQVKNSYELALQHQTLPKEMHFLFQKVLSVGKKVRTALPLKRGTPELEHALFLAGQQQVPDITSAKILFIGASEINCKVIRYFKLKNCQNISLCNRSVHYGRDVANKYQLKQLFWKDLDTWQEYDLIIVGTKAPHYLISNNFSIESVFKPKLIMDLSVPRNVDPAVGLRPDVTLMNIDEINDLLHYRKENMMHTLIKMEEIVLEEARKHVCTFKEKTRCYNALHITA